MSLDLTKAAPAPAWLAECTPPGCLLCGRPTAYTGVWPHHGRRLIVYGLCKDCAADPDLELVETLITARLRVN